MLDAAPGVLLWVNRDMDAYGLKFANIYFKCKANILDVETFNIQ